MKSLIEALKLFVENVGNRYVEYKAKPTYTYVNVLQDLE